MITKIIRKCYLYYHYYDNRKNKCLQTITILRIMITIILIRVSDPDPVFFLDSDPDPVIKILWIRFPNFSGSGSGFRSRQKSAERALNVIFWKKALKL